MRVMQPSKGMESEVWGREKTLGEKVVCIGFLGDCWYLNNWKSESYKDLGEE